MTFIIDKSAYKTACLYSACGYEVIALLYLKKHMGDRKCGIQKRQG